MNELVVGLLCGFSLGFGSAWFYFWRVRMLRTRREWYADPVIRRKHGEDPNPGGWTYYSGEWHERDLP